MAITLAKIAELAGVSRGTVDRALNNRGRVDSEVASRIKRIAKEHDYQPNRAGKALALAKNPLKIGVVLQSVETKFMSMVLEGVEHARDTLAEHGAQVIIKTTESISVESQLALLEELLALGAEGIAIAPANDDRIREKLTEIAKHVPIVTFNTDMPACGRMCFVGQNTYESGRAAAGLMAMLLGDTGKVLVITGHPSNLSHMRRSDGFMDELVAVAPGIEMLPLEKCYDRNDIAHEIVCDMLRAYPDITGVFLSANGQVGACRALQELGLQDKVKLICYDLTPENRENVLNGTIDFLIDQDSFKQGTLPAQTLYDFLFSGAMPENEMMLTDITIKTKYNI